MLLTKQLLVAINSNRIVFYTMEVNCSFVFLCSIEEEKKLSTVVDNHIYW